MYLFVLGSRSLLWTVSRCPSRFSTYVVMVYIHWSSNCFSQSSWIWFCFRFWRSPNKGHNSLRLRYVLSYEHIINVLRELHMTILHHCGYFFVCFFVQLRFDTSHEHINRWVTALLQCQINIRMNGCANMWSLTIDYRVWRTCIL